MILFKNNEQVAQGTREDLSKVFNVSRFETEVLKVESLLKSFDVIQVWCPCGDLWELRASSEDQQKIYLK